MRSSDPLRLPLTLAAAYMLLAGLVQLFPSLSEAVFGRPIADPAIESLYGTALLALGAFTAILAGQRTRSTAMVWAVVGAFILSAVDLAAYWWLGAYTARTALAPVLINLVFAAWIGSAVARVRAPSTQATGV